MSRVNDPALKSWLPVPDGSDFPIQNLPYGIFSTAANPEPRIGVAIGEYVLGLEAPFRLGYFDDIDLDPEIFQSSTLNDFIALGKPVTNAVRESVSRFLDSSNEAPDYDSWIWTESLIKQSEVNMHLPLSIPNYTDFYSSREHATNVGAMFRDPKNALLPNWLHLPVAYHGRASSIVVSGTPLHRPKGQTKADTDEMPTFGPTKSLDFELEMAFVIGKATELGESISTAQAEEHIFGMVLFNDWSARDLQRWEYVPLGPFLAKNFGSTMSPWVVTLEALEPFRVAGPRQEPAVLPYLQFEGPKNYDIHLDVLLRSGNGAERSVSHSNFKYMYWNMCQQLAHHTVNGCNVSIGDLYASGTISGPTHDSYGSMLELTWGGKNPLQMPDGSERKFINDNDSVIIRGYATKDGLRIGFGECSGKILPAL